MSKKMKFHQRISCLSHNTTLKLYRFVGFSDQLQIGPKVSKREATKKSQSSFSKVTEEKWYHSLYLNVTLGLKRHRRKSLSHIAAKTLRFG